MKEKYRYLAQMLVAIMIICSLNSSTYEVNAEVIAEENNYLTVDKKDVNKLLQDDLSEYTVINNTMSLDEVRAVTDGKYWNHKVSGSYTYADYLQNNRINTYSYCFSTQPCTNHGIACPNDGTYDCNAFNGKVQCKGFAYMLASLFSNVPAEDWETTTDINNVQQGDIVTYFDSQTDSTWGHTVYVLAVDGLNISVAEANVNNICLVKWGRVINLSEVRNVEIRVHPDYTSSSDCDEDYDDGESNTGEEETIPTYTENGFKYTVDSNGNAQVVGYDGADSSVIIPAKLGGYTVSAIGDSAFYKNINITKITIPSTVTEIQYCAFAQTTKLKSISFPNSKLKTISNSAFSQSGITSFSIPNTVLSIGSFCFSECESLKTISIGKKVKTIGRSAFKKDKNIIKITIPNSVRELGVGAFEECTKLSTVSIGKGLSKIENYVFAHTAIKQISIPSNVKTIGYNAFGYTNLKSIIIPKSVKEIADYAFQNCKKLKKIEIGAGVTDIGEGVFINCGTTSVKINGKVKCIGDYAFQNNAKLTTINIPNTVTEIQYATFKNCTNLSKITFPSKLEKVGGQTFNGTKWYAKQKNGAVYTGKVFYTYKGKLPANITIKNGTKGIAGFALCDCKTASNVKKIVIPNTVTNIGELAFANCSKMKSIVIPSSVKEIRKYALGYVKSKNGNYSYSEHYDKQLSKINNFTIYGKKGSEAERYAKENGFKFVQR